MSFLSNEGKMTRFGDVARVADWVLIHKPKGAAPTVPASPGTPQAGAPPTAVAPGAGANSSTPKKTASSSGAQLPAGAAAPAAAGARDRRAVG